MSDDTATPPRKDLLSTGSTLLNLASTGDPFGGFVRGKYVLFVGDSDSGKTFLSMTCFAEATLREEFKNYRFIYDNGEDGMHMDLDRLFNEEVADRMEPPAGTPDEPVYSDTAEQFYYHLDDAIYQAGWDSKKGQPSSVKDPRPFIYVLDSENNLDSEAADKKFYQHKAAFQKARKRDTAPEGNGEDGEGEKLKGSYGDGKAKLHSQNLRKAKKGLRQTGSILVIISQTRDNPTAMFNVKTRAGGHALRFYAVLEWWSRVVGPVKKNVRDKERKVGTRIAVAVKKNHITGLLGEVQMDIHPNYGIDDLGSVVDYLVDEGYWPAEKQTITCRGLPGVVGTREKVIKIIERQGLEDAARVLAGKCWAEVQVACALKRKARYAQ